ncbi:Ras family protein [Teladorsagia circumcincta]|uniref:Ras family protein n=1 Tax=Teladorsagia circumcincta TaxID=45464 RepID=A0A2G9V498_TELCI|nr:Ras family protein [Teladorsagia circumcincta]
MFSFHITSANSNSAKDDAWKVYFTSANSNSSFALEFELALVKFALEFELALVYVFTRYFPQLMSEERYRLVVLGSAKVGKTNLIRRYLYNEFSEKYKETIEDLHSRQFRIQGVPLPLDILDTNFNFPDMRKLSIASASAFLLVFAVDDVPSFKEMSDLWQEICERRPDIATLPIVVVGNKCDLPTKKIFEATAKAFTNRLSADVRYLEVSAKNNLRVTEIFKTLLELSGFPRCKAGGGGLDDFGDNQMPDELTREHQMLRRVNTARARSTTRDSPREQEEVQKNGHPPIMDKQLTLPSLAIPMHVGDLKRNRSLRISSPRREKEKEKEKLERRPSDESAKLSRSASLIRRTKHLSLRMRRHGDKVGDDEAVDESDCKIQ